MPRHLSPREKQALASAAFARGDLRRPAVSSIELERRDPGAITAVTAAFRGAASARPAIGETTMPPQFVAKPGGGFDLGGLIQTGIQAGVSALRLQAPQVGFPGMQPIPQAIQGIRSLTAAPARIAFQQGADCGCPPTRTYRGSDGGCCVTTPGAFGDTQPGSAFVIGNPCTGSGLFGAGAGDPCFTRPVLRRDKDTGDYFVACAPPRKKPTMNVLNPRALARSTRRLSGFNKRVKRVQKSLRALAR